MLDAKAAQFSGGSEDPYWKQALADFEKSHRPKPPKEGFRGSFTREQRQERLQFFEEFLKDQSTPQEARKVCQDIQNSANDQYTNQSVNFILGNLDYVIKAGDIAFKGGAESFAMAWYAPRSTLVCINILSAHTREGLESSSFFLQSKQTRPTADAGLLQVLPSQRSWWPVGLWESSTPCQLALLPPMQQAKWWASFLEYTGRF